MIETIARSAITPILVAAVVGFGSAGLTIWANQALTEHRIGNAEKRIDVYADMLGGLGRRAAVDGIRLEHIGRRLDAIDARIESLAVAIQRARSLDL